MRAGRRRAMVLAVPTDPLRVPTRLWLAFACFFRVLFDGWYAARVRGLRGKSSDGDVPSGQSSIDPAELPRHAAHDEPSSAAPASASVEASVPDPAADRPETHQPLQLLALLQREGRFIDFVEQDVTGFDDADLGAAARVVHEGCRRALHAHAKIMPLRTEEEDTSVEVKAGYDPIAIKLTGRVTGAPPFRGTLRHRGWRAGDLRLPQALRGHDPSILAPAEVELG